MSMITAHSGCDGTQDNSLEFVNYALNGEADCLEVDVRNVCGRLVLTHDEATSEDNVELREVFRLLRGHPETKINCDLKESNLEELVYQLAEEEQVTRQLIYTGMVNPEKFPVDHSKMKNVEVYLNVENVSSYIEELYMGRKPEFKKILEEMGHIIELLHCCDIAGLNMNYHMCTDEILQYLKEQNVGCSAWTVDDPEEAKRLLSKHIANVTTRNWKQVESMRTEKCSH